MLAAGEAGRLVASALCEFMARNTRSVTTTEYALILAAIAVMVYGTFAYQIWGRLIGSEACPVEAVKNEAK